MTPRSHAQEGLLCTPVCLVLAAVLAIPIAGCARNDGAPPFPVALSSRAASAPPARHDELAWVLATLDPRVAAPRLDRPEAHDRLSRVLGVYAAMDPFAHPELYPSEDDTLAWLVNAHVAWVVALHNAPALRDRTALALRDVPFPLAGGQWTLGRIESEVLARAPAEPRLALCLNPGFVGGPPLPATSFEGHALSWQLAEHAARCGRTPSFWSFDPARRRLEVSEYTAYMPGLPASGMQRARRLLDLVPPQVELRAVALTVCGDALQRCSVALAPLDTSRWRDN